MKLSNPLPNVETHGNEGSEVLMIHGWGMHSGVWRGFAKLLARRHRVTLIDLPGHGHSPMIDDFTLTTLADRMVAIAPDNAHWIGWSLGSKIALHAASVYPERVGSLTMMAGNARFSQAEDWAHAMDLALLARFAQDMMNDYHRTLMQFLSLQTWGMDNAKEILKELRVAVAECPEPNPRALQAGLEILRQADLRDALGQLAMPLLIVLGERDKLAPPKAGEAMQALAPQAELMVLKGASHTPFLSHPYECVARMEQFWNAGGN